MNAHVPPIMADHFGESDLEYFSRRPDINIRNRMAFGGEPPAALLDDESEIAFVRVWLKRGVDGRPETIFREIHYGQWGRA